MLAALGTLADARAEGDGTWLKWHGSANASANDDLTDREFIREWEATPPKGYPTLSPNNLIPIKAAIIRYSQITARGGWKPLPDLQLLQGSTAPRRRHPAGTSGDDGRPQGAGRQSGKLRLLSDQGGTPVSGFERACSHRHRRQAHTIAALNLPGRSARLKQLKTNLQRLEQLSRSLPKKYVVVNIPAAQVEAIEGDRVVTRHAGVVGKPERATPELEVGYP